MHPGNALASAFAGRGTPAYSAVPVDYQSNGASALTFTFTGVNFGPTHRYRQLLVCWGTYANQTVNDPTVASCRINGKVPVAVCTNGAENLAVGALIADDGDATSGSVTIAFPKTQQGGCSILVYRLVNFLPGPSVGPQASISSGGNDGHLDPADIAVAAGGLGLGVAARRSSNFTPTWEGGLVQASNELIGGGGARMSVAFQLVNPGATKNYAINIGTGADNCVGIGSINP